MNCIVPLEWGAGGGWSKVWQTSPLQGHTGNLAAAILPFATASRATLNQTEHRKKVLGFGYGFSFNDEDTRKIQSLS